MSSLTPVRQALDIVRPLPFLLEPLAADPLTARFPLEPNEEDWQGGLNKAALAYLDRVVTSEFKRAGQAIDEVSLGSDECEHILGAQSLLFTVHAALASVGHVTLAVPESTLTWACHRLISNAYGQLLAAHAKEVP